MKKQRADALLVDLEVVRDLAEARALIMRGAVMATHPSGAEHRVEKAGDALPTGTTVRISKDARVYVSRAGEKLRGALDDLQVDVRGKRALDIGLSTGGFTDCLLDRGVTQVHGVDVAYGIVAWKVRSDPRVVIHERTNARTLPPEAFGLRFDLVVVDVSFISIVAILPAIVDQLAAEADLILMVKPQFELRAEEVTGGVVESESARQRAVDNVIRAASELGLQYVGRSASRVPGRDGNVEQFVHLKRVSA